MTRKILSAALLAIFGFLISGASAQIVNPAGGSGVGTVDQGAAGSSYWLTTTTAIDRTGTTVPLDATVMGISINGTTQIPIGDPTNYGLWVEAAPGSALLTAIQAGAAATGGSLPGSSVFFGYSVGGTFTGATATAKGMNVQANPSTGTGAYSPATISTTDQTILAASTAVVFLDLINNSQSATICINFGATATIAAGVCAAGEVTLPPLYHRSWENVFVPTDAIHAVASSAGVPAAVAAK